MAKALLEGHQEHSPFANESVEVGGCCLALVIVVVLVLRQVLGGKNARFKCKTFGLILEKRMTRVESLWPTL